MNVKIVLKRSPVDPENGVWIDGIRQEGVKAVQVNGAAGALPTVTITLIPQQLELELGEPEMKFVRGAGPVIPRESNG